jgi:hypothetical protein
VRHKALDVIGDLALAGGPMWAHVEVERGGHQVHFSLLEALRERPGCWTWIAGSSPLDPNAAVHDGFHAGHAGHAGNGAGGSHAEPDDAEADAGRAAMSGIAGPVS